MNMSYGLTAENGAPQTPRQPKGTYDIQYQEDGSDDILDSNDDGDEFPARAGWYYKQFIPYKGDWMSVDGWFGPFASVDEMPGYVKDNLTMNRPENATK